VMREIMPIEGSRLTLTQFPAVSAGGTKRRVHASPGHAGTTAT